MHLSNATYFYPNSRGHRNEGKTCCLRDGGPIGRAGPVIYYQTFPESLVR